MPEPVLALDLGGTKIRAALVHDAAPGAAGAGPRLEGVAEVPTPAAAGATAILGAALDLAERVRGGLGLRAVGLSSAGVIDGAAGTVTHATSSLNGWAGTDVRTPFAERFAVPVAVLNDVHAHGLGEARFGTGRGRSSLLLVAVGTGIGGALVVDGQILAGARGAAGHVGHLPVPEAEGVPCPCGRTGHLEGLASGPGIVHLAHRLGADGSLADGRALVAEAARADGPARRACRIAGRATGRAVGALANVLDPEAVALTGGVAEAGPLWHEAVAEGLALEAMDVVATLPVLPASAGSHAALLGAAARALDELAP
ncbi:ROK family protein [Brachybacterium saurashtrense]|uniref:ROK family protein n=1 Tax=Brachybacterium saurashtrense TaxID=556288 RepID=A0A345YKG0_9MICO|nr:ROK family protein [Brachybacterium saurashtrense]AXK44412.1 ROK family protein [Brachybacterium saurashtrense]RRR23023.1 ROK family protein [Brachybacterium saurashtrense]